MHEYSEIHNIIYILNTRYLHSKKKIGVSCDLSYFYGLLDIKWYFVILNSIELLF